MKIDISEDELDDLINQLDEPEVLSQEFIDEHEIRVMGVNRDYVNAVPVDKLQNILVPKQELPVIPKFVAYVIEAYKSNSILTDLLADLAFHGGLAEFVEHEDEDEVFEWARSNRKATDEILAQAWLYGYEVEEKQKYFAKIKGHENIDSDDKYWNYCIADESLEIGDNKVHADVLAEYVLSATKDDWNNLGINEHNADFLLVEELEE